MHNHIFFNSDGYSPESVSSLSSITLSERLQAIKIHAHKLSSKYGHSGTPFLTAIGNNIFMRTVPHRRSPQSLSHENIKNARHTVSAGKDQGAVIHKGKLLYTGGLGTTYFSSASFVCLAWRTPPHTRSSTTTIILGSSVFLPLSMKSW